MTDILKELQIALNVTAKDNGVSVEKIEIIQHLPGENMTLVINNDEVMWFFDASDLLIWARNIARDYLNKGN